jgi:4-aminobutyrate aminotransferase
MSAKSTSHATSAEDDHNASSARRSHEASVRLRSHLVVRDEAAFFHQVLSTPCLDEVATAEGAELRTTSGNLLDFHGNSVHQLGHAHPEVREAIVQQMQRLCFSPRRFTNAPAVELAERLIATAPARLAGNARVLFAPSGAVAVGIALKIARAVTGRHKTIGFEGSFHGATIDAASAGGQDLFRAGQGPMLPGSLHVAAPASPSCAHGCRRHCNSACASEIEQLLEREPDVAAVIAESIRATTVRVPPRAYWERVRAACDRAGALLIFDEIPTCLGRSGALWATEHTGVTPDLLVIGKGLGGGVIPFAAVIGRADLNDSGAVPVRELAVGHYTHEKSPVGSAAANAVLDVIERDGLIDRANESGHRFADRIRAGLAALPANARNAVVETRQLGMMLAVEFTDADTAARVMYAALDRGLNAKVGGGNNLVLFPPLTTPDTDLDRAADIVAAATLDAVSQASEACRSNGP